MPAPVGRDQPGSQARGEAGRSPWQSAWNLCVFSEWRLKSDEQVVHFPASGLAQRAGCRVELSCAIPGHSSSTHFFRDSLIFPVSGVEIPFVSHVLVAAESGELRAEFPSLVEVLGIFVAGSRGTMTLPESW